MSPGAGRSPWLSPSRVGPLAAAAALCAIVGAVLLGPGPVRWLRVLGGVVGLGALPLAFLPFRTLRRHGQPPAEGTYMDTTVVVDRGLYGWVRHPQYLAYILFMVAFSLLAQHLWVTLCAGLTVLFLDLTAVMEERECASRWGLAYREYLERVPRFNLLAGAARRWRRGR